jgi:hypothetical protein
LPPFSHPESGSTQVFFDAEGREIGRHMGVIGKEDVLRRLGIGASGSGGT